MRIAIQLFGYNLGDLGNNEISLDWALLDYQWHDAVGFRVGKFKNPWGLFNIQRDYDMLRTSILLPQGVYSVYQREVVLSSQGINMYGKLSLGALGRIGYDIYGGTGENLLGLF